MNAEYIQPHAPINFARLKSSLCIIGILANCIAVALFFLAAYDKLGLRHLIDDCTFTSWLLVGWGLGLLLPIIGFFLPGKVIPTWLFLILVIHYGAIVAEAPFAVLGWALSCGGPISLFG